MGILQPLLSWKESQANGHILYDILHERIIGCNATAFTMLGFGDMGLETRHLPLEEEVLQRVKQFFLIIKGSLILLHHYQNCIFIAEGAMNAFPRYCYKIPNDYPLASATLLCAGITVYTPMILHKMNQWDKSLGIIGLGGLGHMAVKFGKAFGLHVTVFSSISKKDDALNLLGVDRFVVSSDGRWRGEDISFLFGTSIAALIIGLMLRNSILKGGL